MYLLKLFSMNLDQNDIMIIEKYYIISKIYLFLKIRNSSAGLVI